MHRILGATMGVVVAFRGAAPADLDEARRLIRSDRPEAALAITTAALAEDPHDPTAHALHLRALYARGRTRDAFPALDAWAAEAPWDPRPLRILVAGYALLFDGKGLASISARATEIPEEPRRELLRAAALAQLGGGRWQDAAATLTATPVATGEAPEDHAFRALDAARRGDRSELFRLLGSHPEIYTFGDGEVPWWITKLLDGAPSAEAEPKDPDPVGGGTVQADAETPLTPRDDFEMPVLIRGDAPVLPEEARLARRVGRVVILAVITTSGLVADPEILKASDAIFIEPARRAVLSRRYQPAKVKGEAVSIYYTVIVHFKLRKSEE